MDSITVLYNGKTILDHDRSQHATTMTNKSEYIPGVCNIGRTEARKRLIVGCGGAICTLVAWAAMVFTSVPREWRLLLFLPSSLAALGFLQYRFRFCAAFGLMGRSKLDAAPSDGLRVEAIEFRRHDRRKALVIVALTVLIAAVIAIGAYLLTPTAI